MLALSRINFVDFLHLAEITMINIFLTNHSGDKYYSYARTFHSTYQNS
jgi:hypothetical protein